MSDLPGLIGRTAEVSVFGNSFGQLFNDETVGPTGAKGRYLRWVWAREGVITVPRRGPLVGIWHMFRYPIGETSWEFPRGGIDDGETLEGAARRELREETGWVGGNAQVVGSLHAESGLIANAVSVVEVAVDDGDSRGAGAAEAMEAIADDGLWLTHDEFTSAIGKGTITCGLTIAAWAMSMAAHRG